MKAKTEVPWLRQENESMLDILEKKGQDLERFRHKKPQLQPSKLGSVPNSLLRLLLINAPWWKQRCTIANHSVYLSRTVSMN